MHAVPERYLPDGHAVHTEPPKPATVPGYSGPHSWQDDEPAIAAQFGGQLVQVDATYESL